MAEQDPPAPILPPLPNPFGCNCFGSRPPEFHPPLETLSEIDLDICEIIALSLLAGADSLDYDTLKWAFTYTECFRCMTPRQKREYEIWWVLFLPGCTTDQQMRTLINTIKAKQTPDAIAAALTGLRTYVWDYATCADI